MGREIVEESREPALVRRCQRMVNLEDRRQSVGQHRLARGDADESSAAHEQKVRGDPAGRLGLVGLGSEAGRVPVSVTKTETTECGRGGDVSAVREEGPRQMATPSEARDNS